MIAAHQHSRRRRMVAFGRRLLDDQRGTAVMEFGLMATVFMVLLFGLFDMGQMVYAQAVLNGAVERAARDSSLEGGDTAVADAAITSSIQAVAPNAVVTTSRISYFDFADIGRPESWDDDDGSGVCDDDEQYTDENGNGQWDADVGTASNGSASDVVIYTVSVSYPPLFGMPFLPGGSENKVLSAKSIKKNQPFALQDTYGSASGICADV